METTPAATTSCDQCIDAPISYGARMAELFQGLGLNEPIPSWHGVEATAAPLDSLTHDDHPNHSLRRC
jgi:hypothetical protein